MICNHSTTDPVVHESHFATCQEVHDPVDQGHKRQVLEKGPDLYDCYFNNCQVVVAKWEGLQKHIYWQHVPKANRSTRPTKLLIKQDVEARALTTEDDITAIHGAEIESQESWSTHNLRWCCPFPESSPECKFFFRERPRWIDHHLNKTHLEDLKAYMEYHEIRDEKEALDDMKFQMLCLKKEEKKRKKKGNI